MESEIMKLLSDVENPIEFITTAKKIQSKMNEMQHILDFAQSIFQFVLDTKEAGQPMMTEYLLKVKDEPDISLVSFWAAVGKHNPIERISKIRKQRDKLYDVLINLKNAIEYTKEERETDYTITPEDFDAICEATSITL